MTTSHLTSTDLAIRDAVMQQLAWDSEVDASAVGVAAKDGTVTLTGYVDTYTGKLAAERAAKLVHGVRSIANEIDVRPRIGRTDADIAADVTAALRLRESVPENVQAVVHDGHVTLTGHTDWLFQKQSAEIAAAHVRGVKHVINYVTVAPRAVSRDLQKRIARVLHHQADLDARHIDVSVHGSKATLSGRTESWYQRELAERAAASAPGITEVDNRIVVDYPVRATAEE